MRDNEVAPIGSPPDFNLDHTSDLERKGTMVQKPVGYRLDLPPMGDHSIEGPNGGQDQKSGTGTGIGIGTGTGTGIGTPRWHALGKDREHQGSGIGMMMMTASGTQGRDGSGTQGSGTPGLASSDRGLVQGHELRPLSGSFLVMRYSLLVTTVRLFELMRFCRGESQDQTESLPVPSQDQSPAPTILIEILIMVNISNLPF